MWRTTTKLRRITGLVRTRGGRGGSRTFEGIRGLGEGGFLWEGTRPLWTFSTYLLLNLLLSILVRNRYPAKFPSDSSNIERPIKTQLFSQNLVPC